MKKKNVRGSKFTMLLSKDEQVQLHALADREGVPASVYLRMLIRFESALPRAKRKIQREGSDGGGGSARKTNGAA